MDDKIGKFIWLVLAGIVYLDMSSAATATPSSTISPTVAATNSTKTTTLSTTTTAAPGVTTAPPAPTASPTDISPSQTTTNTSTVGTNKPSTTTGAKSTITTTTNQPSKCYQGTCNNKTCNETIVKVTGFCNLTKFCFIEETIHKYSNVVNYTLGCNGTCTSSSTTNGNITVNHGCCQGNLCNGDKGLLLNYNSSGLKITFDVVMTAIYFIIAIAIA